MAKKVEVLINEDDFTDGVPSPEDVGRMVDDLYGEEEISQIVVSYRSKVTGKNEE